MFIVIPIAILYTYVKLYTLNYQGMDTEKLPEILTLKQACQLLNCHANTLRNWEKQGLVGCIRFGKRGDRRFEKAGILKLIKK